MYVEFIFQIKYFLNLKFLFMKKTVTLGCVLMLAFAARTQVTLPALKAEDFMEGFTLPLGIENCGDERLFIVEQGGKIWITLPDGSKLPNAFLDISDRVYTEGGEQGLLGLAFDPDYSVNGYLYVNYTSQTKGNTSISRFTVNAVNPNRVNKNTELVLLKVKQPFENHNGGQLRFGPDGYLYIGLGDGGDAGDPYQMAQNPGELLGKLLRIDVHSGELYGIPDSNPFKYVAGYKPEIYAIGLRNPWRFSFDRLTGDLWLADVGQNKYEEINFQAGLTEGGQNYGWDCKEGKHKFEPGNCSPLATLTNPIIEYSHAGDDCTVVGGFVYRGTIYPNMFGKYFYNDYCSGRFSTIYNDGGTWVDVPLLMEEPFEYVTFGEDMHGELYVADIAGGEIYKLIDTSGGKWGATLSEIDLTLFPNPSTGQFQVKWIANATEKCTIEIMNTYGQNIYSETAVANVGMNTWTYSNNSLLPGSYIIVIKTKIESTRTQFVVQN